MNNKTVSGIHWSFWVAGAAAVVWNAMGCMNFISQMNAEAVSAMPEWYREMIESRPAWATAAFATAVFGGALGGVLLLLKKSISYYVFIASLVGAILAQLPVIGIEGFPVAALIGGLMQVVVGALLAWYSRRSEKKGWVT